MGNLTSACYKAQGWQDGILPTKSWQYLTKIWISIRLSRSSYSFDLNKLSDLSVSSNNPISSGAIQAITLVQMGNKPLKYSKSFWIGNEDWIWPSPVSRYVEKMTSWVAAFSASSPKTLTFQRGLSTQRASSQNAYRKLHRPGTLTRNVRDIVASLKCTNGINLGNVFGR